MNDNSWCFVLFLNIYMSATCQLLNMFWPFPLVFLLSSCNISLGTFLGSPAIMVSGLSPQSKFKSVCNYSRSFQCIGRMFGGWCGGWTTQVWFKQIFL